MEDTSPSAGHSIDDFENINAFLKSIGGTRIEKSTGPSFQPSDVVNLPSTRLNIQDVGIEAEEKTSDSGAMGKTSEVASFTSRDLTRPLACSHLESTRTQHTVHQQQELPDQTSVLYHALTKVSKQSLYESQHAGKTSPRPLAEKTPNTPIKNVSKTAMKRQLAPESQKAIVDVMRGINFQDSFLRNFREQKSSPNRCSAPAKAEETRDESASKPAFSKTTDEHLMSFFAACVLIDVAGSEKDDNASIVAETDPFPVFEVQSPTMESSTAATEVNLAQTTPTKEECLSPEWSAKDLMQTFQKATDQPRPQNVAANTRDTANGEKAAKAPADESEDRDHLTYFAQWGTAATRSEPRARPRTVILQGLPSSADETLVASLLHGGAIESFKLLGSEHTRTKNATALFVEADAAEKYYKQYPNGLVFNHKGQRCLSFVEMGDKVDVLSSLLRGQLEAGASRVVRATGADEDWGMRALHKLAEAKSRKLEGIADYWRDEVRTIVFRFTNIPDAVKFRGQLMRDEEWEACNIQFVDDPCAKAAGLHMDS